MCGFPQFAKELQALGKNDKERAAALHVTPMTVQRYRKALPKTLQPFTRNPQLLRALASDAEAKTAGECCPDDNPA
jgi:hypothetical protein